MLVLFTLNHFSEDYLLVSQLAGEISHIAGR
jgi:hypothetical protein